MFNEDEREGSAVTFELRNNNRIADPFIFNNVYYHMKELVTTTLEVFELKWFLSKTIHVFNKQMNIPKMLLAAPNHSICNIVTNISN